MTLTDFIRDALDRENEMLLIALDGLTPEELSWRPGPEANPIGWTLWHMFRVEDMWVQFFSQRQLELWERDAWHQQFGLPTRDNGFGHSPEQVGSFPALDLARLLEYGRAVRRGTLEYLESLGPDAFDTAPRERRPELTLGAVFRQLLGELYQHLGQIAYVRGLRRGFADALPPDFASAG